MRAYVGKPNNTGYTLVDVQLEPEDTWSADVTLAHVILPVLQQFRNNTNGIPAIDLVDLPAELHKNVEDCQDISPWYWVLDEMIYAFKMITKPEMDEMFSKPTQNRVENGLRLFGKYYRALWD